MNIHGLNDYNQNRRARPADNGSAGFFGNNEGFEALTIAHLQAVEQHKVLYLSGRRRVKNPKD